uniref:RNase H type-1 domain-containing protein n=1 Tax=Cajanus cajan TaxID=3821 RepID=A0A151SU38_CAJCA|nr:hypothetical protein KK1_004578 [Cajanus cajan]
MILWSMWHSRNALHWSNTPWNPDEINLRASSMFHDWATANRIDMVQRTKTQTRQRWSPPPQGSFKCNIATHSFPVEGLTGIGICIRDHQGAFVRARSTTIKGCLEPHISKVFALLHAINWTHNQNLEDIIFETDCNHIPSYFSNHHSVDITEFDCLLDQCKPIMVNPPNSHVSFSPRFANIVAHN